MKRIFWLCLGIVGLTSLPALARTLMWNLPTTYTNGEPLVVKESRIYEGGALLKVVPAPATATSVARKPLTSYTVTALDAVGAESAHSTAATTGPFTPGKPFGCRWQ